MWAQSDYYCKPKRYLWATSDSRNVHLLLKAPKWFTLRDQNLTLLTALGSWIHLSSLVEWLFVRVHLAVYFVGNNRRVGMWPWQHLELPGLWLDRLVNNGRAPCRTLSPHSWGAHSVPSYQADTLALSLDWPIVVCPSAPDYMWKSCSQSLHIDFPRTSRCLGLCLRALFWESGDIQIGHPYGSWLTHRTPLLCTSAQKCRESRTRLNAKLFQGSHPPRTYRKNLCP